MTTRARKPAPPKRDRSGYYTHPANGERYMSVTTILSNGIPKPALMHWAAFEAAACAVESIPDLVKARGETARTSMRTWIQHAAERKRDTAANLGTAVHNHLEARILGTPSPDFTEEERPFIEAFDRFLNDWQPEYEATELTVANTEYGYAGTLDAKLRLPSLTDELLEVDYKTGKSVYPEVGMQLAAYRRANVGWTKDGTEITPPTTVGAFVLHIRPAHLPGGEPNGYALRPVKTSDDVFEKFLAAQKIAQATLKGGLFSTILGEPMDAPVKTTTAVA